MTVARSMVAMAVVFPPDGLSEVRSPRCGIAVVVFAAVAAIVVAPASIALRGRGWTR